MKQYIAIPITAAILAVAGAVYVGVKTFDGPVVDEPYEAGLRWDEERNDRDASGLTVSVETQKIIVGAGEIVFKVVDSNGAPWSGEAAVVVDRPSSAGFEKTYSTASEPHGAYRATIELPLPGYWDVSFVASVNGKQISFTNRIYAEERK